MTKDVEVDRGKRVDFKVTAENYREITDGDVDGAFTIITQTHDAVAVDNLIRFFTFTLLNGDIFGNYKSPTRRKVGGKERVSLGKKVLIGKKEEVFLNFISFAFTRYVEGRSLDAAFGLTRVPGQRDLPDHSDRDIGVAAKVELLVRAEMHRRGITERHVMRRSKDGKKGRLVSTVKMEPIYEDAAKNTDVKWKSVEKIFSEFGTSLASTPASILSLLADRLVK